MRSVSDLFASYGASILAIAIVSLWFATQPQYRDRRAWIVGGAVTGLVLYVTLDMATRGGQITFVPGLVLAITAALLAATLIAPPTRARLREPAMLTAVLLLAAMVVTSTVTLFSGSAGPSASIAGVVLGVLPFAVLAVIALTVSRLRGTRRSS
jgi:drug/metabolite transporter (DMT)-like permease